MPIQIQCIENDVNAWIGIQNPPHPLNNISVLEKDVLNCQVANI